MGRSNVSVSVTVGGRGFPTPPRAEVQIEADVRTVEGIRSLIREAFTEATLAYAEVCRHDNDRA